jgi:1,4-dihydroxy-2-naphthoyl-CoA hydrolase
MPDPRDPSPFDDLLGTEWVDYDPEHAQVRLRIDERHRQPLGLVHGGVMSTLVESICSRATALAVADEGKIATGQSLDVSFLKPLTEGTVTVTARARHRGRTTWVWDAEARDDGDRLGVLARMTVAVRPRPDAA